MCLHLFSLKYFFKVVWQSCLSGKAPDYLALVLILHVYSVVHMVYDNFDFIWPRISAFPSIFTLEIFLNKQHMIDSTLEFFEIFIRKFVFRVFNFLITPDHSWTTSKARPVFALNTVSHCTILEASQNQSKCFLNCTLMISFINWFQLFEILLSSIYVLKALCKRS